MNDGNSEKTNFDTNSKTNNRVLLQKYNAQRKYYYRNKEKINKYHNIYVKRRRKLDLEYKLRLASKSYVRFLKNRPRNRKINIRGYTTTNPIIKLRREKAEDILNNMPDSVVTVKDMIKYYISGDYK